MDYETWQQRRKEWMEVEKKERSINWQQARGDIQKAITEQAVRELFDRVEALESKVQQGSSNGASGWPSRILRDGSNTTRNTTTSGNGGLGDSF